METILFEVILIELKNQKYELCVHILYELCDHILYELCVHILRH